MVAQEMVGDAFSQSSEKSSSLEDYINEMKSLVAHGDYDKAVYLGSIVEMTAEASGDPLDNVEFWFFYTLSTLLARGIYNQPLKKLRSCTDYTVLYEGDIVREEAVRAIRQGRLLEATTRLREAATYYEGLNDPSRTAALLMVEARIKYGQRMYSVAFTLHEQANQIWEELDNAKHAQSILNNQFHWWKAAVASKQHVEAHRLGIKILKDDESSRRQLLVHAVSKVGRPALWTYDRLERRHTR